MAAMTKEEALQAVIDKWQDVVNGGSDPGPSECALCNIFNNEETTDLKCKGCPISHVTGHPRCHGTPWMRWLSVTSGLFGKADTPEKMEVAMKNLVFCQVVQLGIEK